jgi:N-acetylneuraminate synthase
MPKGMRLMAVSFMAEVSSNHHCDLSRCLRFIDESAAVGCSAVKFQLFKVHELFAPEVLKKKKELRDRVNWELPVGFLSELSQYSHAKGLEFSCTPFYLKAVDELLPYVDFYKIASYELMWTDLLKACAQTGKPVILSTGMATLDEVSQAVEILRSTGCKKLQLLHCVSGYPTPIEDCNLQVIQTLRDNFKVPVGWSDHSVKPGVIYRAVHRWNASTIEFHLDLDGLGDEFKTGHCWLPAQIKEVIANTKCGEFADGNGEKVPAASELPDREWRADPVDGLRPLRHVRESWK